MNKNWKIGDETIKEAKTNKTNQRLEAGKANDTADL